MVARINECDRHRLQQLLADELSMVEAEGIHQHLENCTSCRADLETLAAEQSVWTEMPRYLQRDHSDPGAPLAAATHSVFSKTMVLPAIETVLERLSESENPAMLGRLGEYDILEVVGAGGMGVVLKGYDRQLNRFVAIKVLAPHYASNAAARTRFAREAKAAAAVVHPHVVSIHGVADAESLPYFIMQYVPGQSLQQRIDSAAPMEIKDVLRIGAQTAQGLAAAHAQGLVHRDIKPANILLENGVERVLISDFGLARAADDASMTQSGVIAGTPQFMSPEQARGEPIDGRSDLFSLGSVMYAMCTGHSPFRAETTVGVLSRIYNETPRCIRKINSDVPDYLAGILDRLLAKDPDDRFQSADETAQSMNAWLAHIQQPDVVPRPDWPPRRPADGSPPSRTTRVLLGLCGGFLFLIAAVVVVLELNKGTLEIHCDAKVPIRIMHDGDLYREVTITPTENEVRIAAGNYVVELDGEFEDLAVENGGDVSVSKQSTRSLRIIRRQPRKEVPPAPKTDVSTPQTLVAPSTPAEPAAPQKNVDALQKWQGVWTVVRSQNTAAGMGGGGAHDIYDFLVQGETIQTRSPVNSSVPLTTMSPDRLVLDDTTSPAHFTFEKKVPIWGIYQLNQRGDRLTICFRKSDSERADVRPSSFEVEGEPDTLLYVFQKAPESSITQQAMPTVVPEATEEPVFQGKTWIDWMSHLRGDGTNYQAFNAIDALRIDAPEQQLERAVTEWLTKVRRERDPQQLATDVPVLCLLAGEQYTSQALEVIMSAISRQPEKGYLSIYESRQEQGPTLLSSVKYAMIRLDESLVRERMHQELEQGKSQCRHFALAFCDHESSESFASGPPPIKALLAACQDDVLVVRRRAIAKLAMLYPKDKDTAELLYNVLDGESDLLAGDAESYLARIDPSNEELIARLIKSARSGSTYKEVMSTTSLLAAAKVNPAALRALQDLLSDATWGNRLHHLGEPHQRMMTEWDQVGVPAIHTELIGRYGQPQNHQGGRRAALLGLGRLLPQNEGSISDEDEQKVMQILREQMKHENQEIRYAAAQAIEAITGEELNVN